MEQKDYDDVARLRVPVAIEKIAIKPQYWVLEYFIAGIRFVEAYKDYDAAADRIKLLKLRDGEYPKTWSISNADHYIFVNGPIKNDS